jgi:hypothetical protein
VRLTWQSGRRRQPSLDEVPLKSNAGDRHLGVRSRKADSRSVNSVTPVVDLCDQVQAAVVGRDSHLEKILPGTALSITACPNGRRRWHRRTADPRTRRGQGHDASSPAFTCRYGLAATLRPLDPAAFPSTPLAEPAPRKWLLLSFRSRRSTISASTCWRPFAKMTCLIQSRRRFIRASSPALVGLAACSSRLKGHVLCGLTLCGRRGEPHPFL